MGSDDNLSNVISQDEIDKLAGMADDKGDEKKEESIDISSMLSQDEINEVAGNLNELTEKNSKKNNSLTQEEIDKLSGLTEDSEPETPASVQTNVLSQEEIDNLSGLKGDSDRDSVEQEDEKKENFSIEQNKNKEKEIQIDMDGSSLETKVFEDTNGAEDSNLENEKKSEESVEVKKWKKKKIIIILGSTIALIILFVIGYFLIGNNSADKPKIAKEEMATNEEVLLDNKKKEDKKEKKIIKKDKILETINKGVELFFNTYKKNGIEEVILKSGELIVEHDMDISEENLRLCFVFDLSASLIDTTLSKKTNKKPDEYFQVSKLNKRYKKRLMNLGHNNDEADTIILNWGKKTINILKEKIKKYPELIKNKT